MPKRFSKQFYNSNAWKACRETYVANRVKIDGGMCEMCHEFPGEELHHKIVLTPKNIKDTNVTLNPDNLMYLCRDCHFKVHRELILKGFRNKAYRTILHNGYYFDRLGQMQPMRVYVVYGAPASGKNTYVEEHKDNTDMVIDRKH